MKKYLLALGLSLAVLPAYAAKPAFFGYGDHIKRVADLPDIEEMKVQGRYVDIGYCYKQLSIMFIPVWNWEERYCGYVDENTYSDVGKEDLLEISKALNADTSWDDGKSKLSMWERVWGKLAFAGVLLLFMLFNLLKSNKSEGE